MTKVVFRGSDLPGAPQPADFVDVAQALAAPFPEGVVKFKPGVVRKDGTSCLPMAFIDARDVSKRLNDVLGILGWKSEFSEFGNGLVKCTLSVRLDTGGEWVQREDVGGPSEQPDVGDRVKAAFSDALKRAAVQFGVGAYIYKHKFDWVAYDSQRKKITGRIELPASWRVAGETGRPRPRREELEEADETVMDHRPIKQAPVKTAQKKLENGRQLLAWLVASDANLALEGRIEGGELLAAVVSAGAAAGLKPDIAVWDKQGVELAGLAVREFYAGLNSASAQNGAL